MTMISNTIFEHAKAVYSIRIHDEMKREMEGLKAFP